MTTSYKRLDKDNAAVLLVDHQAGLLSLVRDIDPDRFKNNVLALADLGINRIIAAQKAALGLGPVHTTAIERVGPQSGGMQGGERRQRSSLAKLDNAADAGLRTNPKGTA